MIRSIYEKDKEDFERQINKIYSNAQNKAYDMLSKNEKVKVDDIKLAEQKHEE